MISHRCRMGGKALLDLIDQKIFSKEEERL
jgi:hypothetical protein